MRAILALEDGKIFEGKSFGVAGEKSGEVVFNTSMTGYQEILTDPSYKGQIVTMTYPLIGNYGVNQADSESCQPDLEGFVIRECSKSFSSWRGEKSLPVFLKEHKIEPSVIFDIRLAAEEAIKNSIIHGNKSDRKKQVSISYSLDDNKFKLAIGDEGEGFRPFELPDPRDEENLLKLGGRGVFLINALMDEVKYNDSGNEVSMVKFIRKE